MIGIFFCNLNKITLTVIIAFSLFSCFCFPEVKAAGREASLPFDEQTTPLDLIPSQRVSSPSLDDILAGLTNKNMPLEERIKLFNPTTTLKSVSDDLKHLKESKAERRPNSPVPDLLLKGVFSIYFHSVMVGELVDEMTPFFETLQSVFPSKKKDKDPFLAVPGTNANQRALLFQYLKKNNSQNKNNAIKFDPNAVLDYFFMDKKVMIGTAVSSFQSEIKSQFRLPDKTTQIFQDNLMERNTLFLEYAVLFGSGTAIACCYSKAKEHLDSKDLQTAKKLALMIANPRNTNAMDVLGYTLFLMGNADEAEEWWNKAVVLGNVSAMSNLGIYFAKKGQIDKAEEFYRKAAEHGGTRAMRALAELFGKGQGKILEAEAMQWCKIAIEKGDPETSTSAMRILAQILHKKGQMNQAKNWLRKAANLGDLGALGNLGLIFCELGQVDEGVECYKMSAAGGNLNAMSNLGQLYIEARGQISEVEAQMWCKTGAELGDSDCMVNLGKILFKNGKKEEARQLFIKASELGNTLGTTNLGYLYSTEGLVDECVRLYRKAAETGDTNAMRELGENLIINGQVQEGLKYLQDAIDKDDRHAMASMGAFLLDMDETNPEGEALLRKAKKLGSKSATLYLGISHYRQGKLKQAEELCHQALKLGDPRALLMLARISNDSSNFVKAEDYFKRAIILGIQNAEIYYAQFLDNRSRQEESLKYLEFHEENIEQFEGFSSDEEASPEDTKEIAVVTSDIEPVQSPPIVEQSVVPALSATNEKEKVKTELSKKIQRYLDRAEKREKASRIQNPDSLKQVGRPRTYQDVKVLILPEVYADVAGEHEIKIQGLISSLANGECRGRFEKLKEYENVYSMRLTKGDRLVVKIEEGDIMNGVKSLCIIAAKGHYTTLNPIQVLKPNAVQMKWNSI